MDQNKTQNERTGFGFVITHVHLNKPDLNIQHYSK